MRAKFGFVLAVIGCLNLSGCAIWPGDRGQANRTIYVPPEYPTEQQLAYELQRKQQELELIERRRQALMDEIRALRTQLSGSTPAIGRAVVSPYLGAAATSGVVAQQTVLPTFFRRPYQDNGNTPDEMLIEKRLKEVNPPGSPRATMIDGDYFEVTASARPGPVAQVEPTLRPATEKIASSRGPSTDRVKAVPKNIIPVPKRSERYVVLFTFDDEPSMKAFSSFLAAQGFKDRHEQQYKDRYRLYLGSFASKDNAQSRVSQIRSMTGLTPAVEVQYLDT